MSTSESGPIDDSAEPASGSASTVVTEPEAALVDDVAAERTGAVENSESASASAELQAVGPTGTVRAGTEEWYVEARGTFEEKDVTGYIPSPESDRLRVQVEPFEGPLDLLLYLIDKHALDIFDIPIARITEEYLNILDDMRTLNLDIAGEFLVMAAKLAHIKSRMLLPKEDRDGEDEEEGDPRAELVRRLLEYQKYRHAAEQLAARNWLGRDVFARPESRPEEEILSPDDPLGLGLEAIDVWELIALLDIILKRTRKIVVHEVFAERLNVGARINELVDFARMQEHFTFDDVLSTFGGFARPNVIVSFLAVLEMAKLKLLRVHQPDAGSTIYLSPILENLSDDSDVLGGGGSLDYAGEGA